MEGRRAADTISSGYLRCLCGGHEHEGGGKGELEAAITEARARASPGPAQFRGARGGARAGVGGEGEALAGGAEFAHERPERRESNPPLPSQGRRREPIGS